jgi:hypothetical protein
MDEATVHQLLVSVPGAVHHRDRVIVFMCLSCCACVNVSDILVGFVRSKRHTW